MAMDMGKKHKKEPKEKEPMDTSKGIFVLFSAASDYEFKEKHPIGYGFLVMLGIVKI